MPLLIGDTNIFIDFEEGELIPELFQISDTIGVPDLLFEKELRGLPEDLVGHGLQVLELSSESVQRVVELREKHSQPGTTDLTAVSLAEQECCCLLTGDKFLRKAAEEEGVEVHGTLWVCERLVDEGVITVRVLCDAYRKMKANGRRLPWTETKKQLESLGYDGPLDCW
jgi:predicted nucleic acid-binding protein